MTSKQMKIGKPQVLAAARRRYGKQAFISEIRNAPTAERRAINDARRREIAARLIEISGQLAALDGWTKRIVKAARFTLDVQGEEPSVAQLEEATAEGEKFHMLVEEHGDLRAERDRIVFSRKRWSVLKPFGLCNQMMHEADTLPELLAAIEMSASDATD